MSTQSRDPKSPPGSGWRSLGEQAPETTTEPASDEPVHRRSSGDDHDRFEGVGVVGGAIALIVAVALLIAAIIQNTSDVGFELFWFDVEAPLVVLLLGAGLFAVLVDEIVGLVWRRRRRELRRLRDQVDRDRPADDDS